MKNYIRLMRTRLPLIGLLLTCAMAVGFHSEPVDAMPNPTEPPASSAATSATEPTQAYTQEELNDLATVIFSQAGATWIPDDIQKYVGSVVLNRVAHDRFPDTIKDVIMEKGQYGAEYGTLDVTPDARTIENARWLLENGSVLPGNVVYQDNNIQGDGIYYTYEDPLIGPTYFCYIND